MQMGARRPHAKRLVHHQISILSADFFIIQITVYSVVLDPMRNQACSGSMDGTVRIWNLQTGQCQHLLTGHTSLVGLLGLSSSHLVSAAADSTLRIWDPDTGEIKHTLAAHTGAITCFQHDEFKVLSGSDGNLKMWNIRDGTVVRDLLTGIVGVWQVVFEGRWCVAASNSGGQTMLDVWDFGKDEDEDWIGESPTGLYEDDSDEDEEDPEVRFPQIRDADTDGDGDAMDQDSVPMQSDSGDIDIEDDRLSRYQHHGRSTPAVGEGSTKSRIESVSETVAQIEGIDPTRWVFAPQASGSRSSALNVTGRTSRGSSTTSSRRVAASSYAIGPSSSLRTLPTTEESPTRPRLRGHGSRRR